ncbi:Conserved_hypothetical protein [Hexamita inflata]|uniref:Uncharacterized protein n=1 Tax=Hexamita inflata TaxID=28002 RepID=A0AA86QSY2_9EUKA|nr:Conserved hypothetical protein [Hexamita inflata]
MTFGPVIIANSSEKQALQDFSNQLSELYNDMIVININQQQQMWIMIVYCQFDFIDYKYIKSLCPKSIKVVSNRSPILKAPLNILTQQQLDNVQFNDQQFEQVNLTNQQYIQLLSLHVGPTVIVHFASQEEQLTYCKEYEHKNVNTKSIELYSAFLVHDSQPSISHKLRRGIIPENAVRFVSKEPMQQSPNSIPITIFKQLLFAQSDWEQIKLNLELEQKSKPLPKEISPKLIYRINIERGTKLMTRMQQIYDTSVLIFKTQIEDDEICIAALYNQQFVNYNTLWYMIPRDVKRFVSRHPMIRPPPFISREIFNQLQFSCEEYLKIQSTQSYKQHNIDGFAVPPRVIIQVDRENADTLYNQLNERLTLTHGHIKISKTKVGQCYIGFLYVDCLIRFMVLKSHFKHYNYARSLDLLSVCPDFVPESCYNELHFNAGLWQSLQDLAEIVTEKQNKHKESKPQKQASSKEENETEESEHESDVESEAQQVEISENVVVVDFEAYIVTKACTSPSEFGAIRFYNGKPVAAFHALLAATAQDLEKMGNPQTKLGQQMKFIQRLTGIPAPGTEQYEALNKAGDYEIVKKAFELFCFGGSENMKQFQNNEISIQCFEEFAADKTRTLVSKGTSLEQKIFGQFFQITERVVDFGFLLGKRKVSIAQQKVYFQNIHSHSRKYKYCPFHDALENKNGVDGTMVHCALDDVWFLADILSAVAEGHTALETEAISNGEQEYEVAEQVGRVVVEGPEEVLQEVLQDALENKWDAEMVGNQLCVYSQFEQNQKVEALLNDQCKLRQFRETGQFEEAVRVWFQKRM